jgi:hypothetical protein
MGGIISILTVVLVLAYVGAAIWFICKRRTIHGSVGASAGFLCGGLIIIPIAEAIATFICWVIVIGLVLFLIGALFGG